MSDPAPPGYHHTRRFCLGRGIRRARSGRPGNAVATVLRGSRSGALVRARAASGRAGAVPPGPSPVVDAEEAAAAG